jgi:hypothetical protein
MKEMIKRNKTFIIIKSKINLIKINQCFLRLHERHKV